MKMIDPATGWLKIIEIPTFNLNDTTSGNSEYIDKLSTRVTQIFYNTCLCRYLRPRKVVFDNGSEFKQDFTPLQNYFDTKPFLKKVKNPQANALVERVHKVILNMLVTKYSDNKVFKHIDPWG